MLVSLTATAQTEVFYKFSDKDLTDGKEIQLQAFEYQPQKWNGKVILFSHDAAGGTSTSSGAYQYNSEWIKTPIKFINISKYAVDNGYVFITYMRKGRGRSGGDFSEELGSCGWATLQRQVHEAEKQLTQMVEQVKAKYQVEQLVLMGIGRGGFLSSYYAGRNPNQVSAVVNLAGTWLSTCEDQSGRPARKMIEENAKRFKPQYWAYFENDRYFKTGAFGDWDYSWFKKVTSENNIYFKVFSQDNRKDGHETPTWTPREWALDIFPRLPQ